MTIFWTLKYWKNIAHFMSYYLIVVQSPAWLKTNRKIAKTKYRYLGEPYRDDNANQKWFQI